MRLNAHPAGTLALAERGAALGAVGTAAAFTLAATIDGLALAGAVIAEHLRAFVHRRALLEDAIGGHAQALVVTGLLEHDRDAVDQAAGAAADLSGGRGADAVLLAGLLHR